VKNASLRANGLDQAQPSPAVPSGPAGCDTLFYDGHCGLCHRWVRFVLARDAAGAFEFAPLQGSHFAALVPPDAAVALPDSLVVRTADGRLLVRSAAVRHLLARIGGPWRALSILTGLCPTRLADVAYDGIARFRKLLFDEPRDVCPVVPPAIRNRFRN
jgi:predicted DCC family thiol-disulfide oxidoreductase YuxK